MEWGQLYFGKLDRKEIQEAIQDQSWQTVRLSMKGISTKQKYDTLCWWKDRNSVEGSLPRKYQVQITNYVTALSRGGLIKPEDYLKN